MITVEDAIAARHHSAGFLLQYRKELGREDRITFPNGVEDVAQLATLLRVAPTYTWARHIKRVVDQSCASYPLGEAIRSLHYFHQPTMFWVFEDPVLWIQPPLSLHPANDLGPSPIDAILIVPYAKGPTRTMRQMAQDMWAQAQASPDERARIVEELMSHVTGVSVTAFSSIRTGKPIPLPLGGEAPAGSRVCCPTMLTTVTFGQSAAVDIDEIVDEQQTDPTIMAEQTRLRQWVLAAAALLKQRILVAEQQIATRGERKRLDRQHLDMSVMTITLRATEHHETPGSNVTEWSHRWIVRGHWRQQWYPSQAEHRVLWIPPYIKGPDDAPLQVRPAVYAVSR